jgi:phosphatidylinositol alpha-1,6-mannosyltransferase
LNKEKNNILIVTSEFPPQPGGIGNHAYNLALYLSKQHYDVEVIADQRSQNGEEEVGFDAYLPFRVIRIERTKLRLKMYIKRLLVTRRHSKKTSYIIATGKFSLWNIGFFTVSKRIKTIAVIHGTEVNFKSFFLRKSIDYALQRFDTIVAVSNYTKALVSHLDKHITVIPNGIDISKWEVAKNLNFVLQGQPSLTTVGRVSARKGQLNVINLLPQLIKQFPELHYHCIGIPTESTAFLKRAEALKVTSYITFHGSIDDRELKQKLVASDIFIMLSSEDESGDVEGFGIAILEANALGVPAIGSINCGIEDAINNFDSGVLVDFENTTQIEKAIKTILLNKNKYQVSSVKWAQQHDWSSVVKSYIALLR